jgi:7-cyano-7-deazaguanine reductase
MPKANRSTSAKTAPMRSATKSASKKTSKATSKTSSQSAAKVASKPVIETFPNPVPGRKYVITHINPEFTSMCPKTGLPDFGTITVRYIPDAICLELKSLKYYFLEFRNQGIFYEAVTNRILDDLVGNCKPLEMDITAEWTPRGGIRSVIHASYKKK